MTDYPRVRGQVRGKKGIPVSQEDFPGDGGEQLGERMAAPPARSRSRTSCSAPGVAVPVHSLSAGWLEVHSGSRVATVLHSLWKSVVSVEAPLQLAAASANAAVGAVLSPSVPLAALRRRVYLSAAKPVSSPAARRGS